MIVDICWKNKKVLIIGTGKQGIRKGGQFEKEGAQVTYRDHGFSFEEIACFDCVAACTNDPAVNDDIIDFAQRCGVFCVSATYSEKASIHMMREIDLDELKIGLSTRHGFLMYGEKIKQDIVALYEKKWKEKLVVLKKLRPYVLGHKDWMRFLTELRVDQLEWLFDSLDKGKGRACIFHSCQNEEQHEMIGKFLEGTAMAFYMNESIETLKEICVHFKMNVTWQPMFIYEGYIYAGFHRMFENAKPLLMNEDTWKKLLEPLDCQNAVFVVHPTKNKKLKNKIASYCTYAQVIELEETVEWIESKMIIYPLFILNGKHVKVDVEKIIQEGARQGIKIEMPFDCLLECEEFRKIHFQTVPQKI